jgi:hypothetical protein
LLIVNITESPDHYGADRNSLIVAYETQAIISSVSPIFILLRVVNICNIIFAYNSLRFFYLSCQLRGEHYTILRVSKYNKAKQHEEKIGTSIVKYLVYPNGKTMVFVACSNYPFKLEDESDVSIIYAFLGQVRDRLLYLVTDPHERIVPPIIKWILTGCDINKDVTVSDTLQLTAINIQLKDADRVFRLYIKSLGDKAVYRVEESVKMRSSIVDALHTIIGTVQSQDPEMNLLTDAHEGLG